MTVVQIIHHTVCVHSQQVLDTFLDTQELITQVLSRYSYLGTLWYLINGNDVTKIVCLVYAAFTCLDKLQE